jgi:anti-sigma regulatory factor (Ser/Thr protein kinase)
MRWTFASPRASDALAKRSSFIAYLRERGDAGEDYGAAEVVFGELVGNVVRHANGSIAIDLDWGADGPTLRVSDRGPGFEFNGCRLGSPEAEGGRGMFLAVAFSESLRVEPNPGGGTRVSVKLRIRRSNRETAAHAPRG